MAKGYKINFTTNTIIMNYTFAAAAAEYGSEEYHILRKILLDFPEMKKVVKSGRNRRTPMKYKNLTYDNMVSFIKTFENSEELLHDFNIVRTRSNVGPNRYKYVREWFVSQFPNYLDVPTFHKENKEPSLHIA